MIKAHADKGCVIYSDQASVYLKAANSSCSGLTRLGYVHFWINHTMEYAHSKFPFITTYKIEYVWKLIKGKVVVPGNVFSEKAVPGDESQLAQIVLDDYSLRDQLKKETTKVFMYKILNRTYLKWAYDEGL